MYLNIKKCNSDLGYLKKIKNKIKNTVYLADHLDLVFACTCISNFDLINLL